MAQEFLVHSRRTNDARTYEFYCYFVCPFVGRFGTVPAATFPPLSFTKWLDEHEGWKGCRRNAIVAVKRMFNWAVKDAGLLLESPLKNVKRPPKKRRNRVITEAEREYVMKTIRDEQFREYVFAMLDTGARPGEVMAGTADHVSRDGAKWTFEEHKTDGHGEARVVYLSPAMQEPTAKLLTLYPEGPLFRSTRKFAGVRRPWTRNGIRCRIKRLREKVERLRAAPTAPASCEEDSDADAPAAGARFPRRPGPVFHREESARESASPEREVCAFR